jgi:hypothetical protein
VAFEQGSLLEGPGASWLEGIEESPEAFVARWRGHAADAELFARPEGVPLFECRVGGAVIQVFERTGPYLARPGPAKLIVNPTAAALVPAETLEPRLEPLGVSRLAASGKVVEREGQLVVVDAGAPLVVAVSGPLEPWVVPGAAVSFESDAPVHGFVVKGERFAVHRREAVDDTI